MGFNTLKERKRLESIKDQLEELREEQREAAAEYKVTMRKLKELYKCNTVKAAKQLLEELEEENEALKTEIETKTNKLFNNMEAEGLM
jgi:hypothetical protein